MAREIDLDRFANELEGILDDVAAVATGAAREGVRDGLKVGAKAWRRNARKEFDGHEYKRHGETFEAGRYARSIRWHMTDTSDDSPTGEIGSPKLPGLAHLLENGHARIGGGRVEGIVHIAPAADEAFDATVESVDRRIGEGL